MIGAAVVLLVGVILLLNPEYQTQPASMADCFIVLELAAAFIMLQSWVDGRGRDSK